MEEQSSKMDFITDPGSTRGRVSLFQQSVKTYLKMKCFLAKALACKEEKSISSSILFELQQMKLDMHEMFKAQIQLNDRIGKIEKQLQNPQRSEQVLGTTAKDPAPVDSSEDISA